MHDQPPVPGRRGFIRQVAGTALLGAGLGTGVSGCTSTASHGDNNDNTGPMRFAHGVASGDPLNDRVILWTRVTPGQDNGGADIAVRWQLATDASMRSVVSSGSLTTSARQDYTVKVDAAGLLPGHVYHYQFEAGTAKSTIGRTKTLPRADVRQVKLAVFSCSNYPFGFFNAYADCALQADIDAALHLGDYIYEYESTGYGAEQAKRLDRLSEPREVLVRLEDYRRRYGQYRSDPDLQAVHAAMPFIVVWDDHEFADDTWRDGSLDHRDSIHGPFKLRKQAAATAYHEWMPVRTPDPAALDRIYRSFDFGSIVSLHMLDTRLIGRDHQLTMSSYLDADHHFDEARYRSDLYAPQRQMMGAAQMAWLDRQVEQSTARWQMLGQQVLMARMEFPHAVVTKQCSSADYVALKRRAALDPASVTEQERRWLAGPSLPCYFDSWDGYQSERERLFDIMTRHRKNMVVLAGDTHNAWASDLFDASGRQVGVEFATPGVTSPGMEGAYPGTNPDEVAAMMTEMIAPLYYAQTSKRGYLIVTASHEQVRCDFRFVDTVSSHAYTAAVERSLRTVPGPGNRKLEECPPV
ncbi:alkaline phosphatase [Duganella sp. Leaf126]|uniref:alkaline phosphatase D family protein n=1 Tax=Duganella sp. Leaf126 TaxID=1736266 RepID=UPI0006FC26FE|nr:alkaline phosphatase D family protein [Duganella sp. Leaf126]KQQ42428.1 alkaline phosphatase [Duganella sp. Leaf126]